MSDLYCKCGAAWVRAQCNEGRTSGFTVACKRGHAEQRERLVPPIALQAPAERRWAVHQNPRMSGRKPRES